MIVTGASSSATTSVDLATEAYSTATGELLWSDRYDGPGHATDNPYAVKVVGDRVYVTGNTEGQGTRFDMSTFAYDLATGKRLWVQRYDGASHYDDTSWGLAVTPDGSKVVITGTSQDTDAGTDYVTIAYDAASGKQVWLGRYDGLVGSADRAHALRSNQFRGAPAIRSGQPASSAW
ncbi:PQQ-like beta-propeller repeat protein [Micromonospora yasonensis]|uniref:PQQ-like beta-propeller repeat protein n=1 Tax=Micromonospora yasonensis TaxID=1128667 RepID=UPI0022316DD3|nr:PQQ-like beta-propeller repeat protein [Micromonospora yasonensis]MCW3839028.1 PQQ-like beta-propeller repeat protein [Micromonospora yasonensis]